MEKQFSDFAGNDVDVIQLNHIRETVKENWDALQNLDSKDFGVDFVVLDNANNILYSSDSLKEEEKLTVEEAIKHRYPYSYVVRDNCIVGCVIMVDSGEDIYTSMKNRMFLAFWLWGFFILLGALLLGLYIQKNIIVPFKQMEDFAGKVAEGKLEQALQRKEKELVASLSHDLKTSITGIKLSAELLKAKLARLGIENLDQIADNIYKKAEQMDFLVSDLFSYTA